MDIDDTLAENIQEPTETELKEIEESINKIEKELNATEQTKNDKPPCHKNTDFFKKALQHKILEYEVERSYFERIKNNDSDSAKLRDIIITHNLRLVIGYARNKLRPGLELGDLFQEGSIGLMKAFDKFDYKKGHRFATYAIWWIMQSVNASIPIYSRIVGIPSNKIDDNNKIKNAIENIVIGGDKATPEDIAEYLNRTTDDFWTSKKVLEVQSAIAQTDSSLEKTYHDSAELMLQPACPHAEREILLVEDKTELIHLMGCLNARQKDVLIRHMGHGETFESIGKSYNVGRERVRQIYNRSLMRIRKEHNIEPN